MKIVPIFAKKLYTFQYKDELLNELDRLLELWNDTSLLYQFAKDNRQDIPKDKTIEKVVNEIINNANEIDDTLHELSKNNTRKLDEFFKPLNNQEYKIVELSKQKGRKNYLRIYALRIDTNCFVITGGAIKFTHLMNERDHTKKELSKINHCRDYLKSNGVIDTDSFYEFLNESI